MIMSTNRKGAETHRVSCSYPCSCYRLPRAEGRGHANGARWATCEGA
jgi:hypothetical protein